MAKNKQEIKPVSEELQEIKHLLKVLVKDNKEIKTHL
jgi:hypothetical protein